MTSAASQTGSHSCLYHGHLVHTRHEPFVHSFRYSLFMVYLDLAELDSVFAGRWLWSTKGPALAWFRRSDHPGPVDVPLDQWVRQTVLERSGSAVTGPIRLLTHLRYFGYVINPISLYYCFDDSGRQVQAVLADVTNTPWGEHQFYVFCPGRNHSQRLTAEMPKQMHVSPFLPMSLQYHWQLTDPADTAFVQVQDYDDQRCVFTAGLELQRRPLTSLNLARALLRHPLMTIQVAFAIYWQALRLWLRGAKFVPHPRRDMSDSSSAPRQQSADSVIQPPQTVQESVST